MDWSKIKTIFILAFLLLDIYLVFQFIKVRDVNKYGYITEASFEDKLKNDNINTVELPKVLEKEQYVSAKPKVFTDEEISKIKSEHISTGDGTTLRVALEKPLKLNSKFNQEEIDAFVKGSILYGDQYSFWEKDDEENEITYFQQFNEKFFLQNMNGQLTFYLNEKNEVTGYVQTLLSDIEILTEEKQEVLPPIRAIETLYKKGLLKPKSNITKVDLGYSTLVQLAASQVLAPTWHFKIDDKEDLYVNAIEGHVIQLNNKEN